MRMNMKFHFWMLALTAFLFTSTVTSESRAEKEAAGDDEATVPTAAQGDEADAENEKEGADSEDADSEDAKSEAEEDGKEHGGGGFHDEKDLGHANASDSLYSPTQWRSDLAIFTFVVFLLLMGVLIKFAWGPIADGLDAREEGIANKIDEASRDAEAAAARLADYDAKLSGAEAEAQVLIAKAQTTAETSASRIKQEAEADADDQKQRARADIDAARGVALDELSNQSVNLAVQLASQIVGRELKQEDHTALIQDALKQFSSSS